MTLMMQLRIVQNEDEFVIFNAWSRVIGYYYNDVLEFGGRWYSLLDDENVVYNNKVEIGKLSGLSCDYPVYYNSSKAVVGMSIANQETELMINEEATQQDKVLMVISEIKRIK